MMLKFFQTVLKYPDFHSVSPLLQSCFDYAAEGTIRLIHHDKL